MGAKEEIALLEQKVDILYNIVLVLALQSNDYYGIEVVQRLMNVTDVEILSREELNNLGK
jgi:hypothetical protein